MGSLIDISAPQYQLRQNRNLWLTAGGVGALAGLLLWSAAPFALSNTKSKVQVILRYLALGSSLCCGVVVVVAGSELNRIAPLIRAVELAEKDDFLSQLATSQYAQQQHWQQSAFQQQHPQQFQSGNAGNSLPEPVTNSVTNGVTDTLADTTVSTTPGALESYRALFGAITVLQQQGVSDSKIIKEVLHQEGSNFEKGKQILATILELGRHHEW